MDKDLDFYRELWERLAGDSFSTQKLAQRLRADGGVDIQDLSHADVLSLIEGRYRGSWAEVSFAASELLATYSVAGGIESGEQVVGWVFAAFAFADAVGKGHADWEIQFDIFMNGFLRVRDPLEPEDSVSIFERVFCAGRGDGS